MPAARDNGQAQAAAPARKAADEGPPAELEARRRTALAQIRGFGDPALRTKAVEVNGFDEALRKEVKRLARLMSDAMGVGLAATQLGLMHRVLVYRAGPDAPLVAVVNPRIEWASPEQELAEEGCLSIPGIVVEVERPVHVRVSARDEDGSGLLVEASGLEARVIQHEIDHLDGVLILDRTSREQRKEALRLLREGPEEPSDAGTEAIAPA